MNRTSVSLKIFYRMLALFLGIIILQMLFFMFVFESFHENRRVGAMQEAIAKNTSTIEASAAGRLDTLLGRFSEEEGVYTEAIDLNDATVFSIEESDTFTLAGHEVVMPPYMGTEFYEATFEVGASIARIELVPHVDEAVYFPLAIEVDGSLHRYNTASDPLNLSSIFELDASRTTYTDRLITGVDFRTERFASLHQFVVEYLVDEDLKTESFREDNLEGEFYKTDNAFGDYYVFITPLTLNNEPHTLFTVMPIEPAYTFIGDVLLFLGATALVTLFLLAGLTYVNAKKIAEPLRSLSADVSRIATLDFTPLHEPKGDDEIATLTRNINTMRQNLEESLERLNAQNTRLKESLERENSLDLKRKDFIASLSHELKTPLSVIEASSEALQDDIFETEEEKKAQLELIQKEIQKSKTLIEGIMDTYKIDRPSYRETFETLDLYRLVEAVLEDTRPVFKNYSVEPVLKGKPAFIEGDREKLALALSNLMTNAAKHTEKGGVFTVRIEPGEDQVTLSMHNAPAIMDAAIIRAFDEQDTLKETTRKEGGVGLHIVRLVLDQHKVDATFETRDHAVRFIARFHLAS